ncbi:hypothetical protein DFJ77DRAFT_546039 [Powellomyces hirtus]|nr:hypothetical protein DFJ77DRAFT_546039 [Powellomyces hirtus]
MSKLKRFVADLRFTNSFARDLVKDSRTPGEPFVRPTVRNPVSSIPRQVAAAHYSYVEPESTPDPVLISTSKPCAELLDIDIDETLSNPQEKEAFIGLVSGNKLPEETNPWAQCYGGHQFGVWASQLGDGRAITIGEVTNIRDEKWEIQLKGAGMTPYSRFADGYAVLRSSIREYLCSEAMHHLGVPTTRALALVGSTRLVQREKEETGAIVARLAPTWVRFGSFEIFVSRGDVENMRKLADWVIQNHYSSILDSSTTEKYSAWLTEVVKKTAIMIAHWQAVGFCHGVMNTDNMSILGLTLDYGPFQFLDRYDPEYICNHSDHTGRYSFDGQAGVGFWNLTKLASTVSPLVVEELGNDKAKAEVRLREILSEYPVTFHRHYRTLMSQKLGFQTLLDDDLDEIVTPLMEVLGKIQPDYTRFFRSLSTDFRLATASDSAPQKSALKEWYAKYRQRLISELTATDEPALARADQDRIARMKAVNPKYILRNHLAQRVIEEAEAGKFEGVNELLRILQNPFEDGTREEQEKWAGPVPAWAAGMKCSCSS